MSIGSVKKQDVVSTGKEDTANVSNGVGQLSPEIAKLITDYQLEDVAKKLIEAVKAELGNGFTPRHQVNKKSPSFPYNHRTMANRDCVGTGPREKILIGKHIFYSNSSILEMLCKDLSK